MIKNRIYQKISNFCVDLDLYIDKIWYAVKNIAYSLYIAGIFW